MKRRSRMKNRETRQWESSTLAGSMRSRRVPCSTAPSTAKPACGALNNTVSESFARSQMLGRCRLFAKGFCAAATPQRPPGSLFRLGNLPILLLAIVALLTPAYSQEFRASITGEVTDSTGAAIPGVSVKAVNVATRVSYSATTNNSGVYTILYIMPGNYIVTVTAPRFQTKVTNNVRLDSSEQLGMNVVLQPGNVNQEVTVTAGAVDLDTVSASIGGVVDQQRVENMPSTGMEVFDDADFVQGARINGLGFNETLRNNSITYAVSGEQTDENAFYLNDIPVSDQGSWYISPNQNSVDQVQVGVMPYDAQYGRTGGGVFSANVKGGTNRFHGSIYDFFGNDALNANTSIADLNGTRKAINIRNTFGGAIGGPIRKGKVFFYGTYEGFRQDMPGLATDTVPTDAWKQGIFTNSGYHIYNPISTTCAAYNGLGGCSQYTRTEFTNDVIPSNYVSPIGQAILALFPEPTNSGLVNNYVVQDPTSYSYDQYIARLDDVITQKTRIYGMFALQNDGSTAGGNSFPNAARNGANTSSRYYNTFLDLSHVFSDSMVLDANASFGHNYALSVTGQAINDNFLASKLGFNMPAVSNTSHQNITPTFAITGMTGLFGNTANGTADADANFSASITEQLGKQSLHYGLEFMDIQTAPTGVLGQPNGTFTFGVNFSQQNPLTATTGSGNEIADVLMGYPSSGSLTWDTPTFITMHYYGAFVQDTYQLLPALTLSAGLRWDINLSPRDRHDRINAGFCSTCTNPYTSQINYGNAPTLQNPLLGGLLFAGVGGIPDAPFENYWNDWQPRVGFSWLAMRNMVVRGGYGIFFPWAPLTVDDIGFSQTTSFVASLDGNLTPDNYLNSGIPYPAGAIAPSGSSLGLETNAGNAISYNDTKRKLRMTQHWSLDVQRKIPGDLLLDVGYIGNNVHGIPMTQSLGVIGTALQQACNADLALCNANVSNPFYGVLASNTTLGASSTIPQWELERANPLFNGVMEQSVPAGSSHFNSMAVRVERRVHSLNFAFNYAYSNWRDRDAYLNSGNFQDPDPTSSLDPSDVRNAFTFNVVYPLPSTDLTRFRGALLNGWLVDSSIQYFTGTPLALPAADFNCSSLLPAGGQTRAHWFNNDESCWANLGTWERRTLPLSVGFIRNPSLSTWLPGLSKQFALERGMSVRFRMEALNGANHPTWGAPSTALATPPSYSPKTNWTGFGTLPTSQSNTPRGILSSLKIIF
jgi:Carboxypeptidase regulatory-like domain